MLRILDFQGSEAFRGGDGTPSLQGLRLSLPRADSRRESQGAIEPPARGMATVGDPPLSVLFRFSVVGKEHVLTQRGGELAAPPSPGTPEADPGA